MNKIKLCFIAPKAYQLFNPKIKATFGGAEVQMSLLAKELSKDEKFDVKFVVGNYGQAKKEKNGNVVLYRYMNTSASDRILEKIHQSVKLFILLKKVDADVYITTTCNPIAGFVNIFTRIFRKKHIHRTASDKDLNFEFINGNGILGKIYKYGLEHADKVFVQREDQKKIIKKNHNVNAIVIRNSFIIPDAVSQKSKKHVLWVSRGYQIKRPEIFLDLAREFSDQNFVMVCPPSESGKNHCYEEIRKKARIINNLEFIDFIPFDKIQELYDEALVFVCTSIHEGFPNTFIQSGIGKTPFLSLDVDLGGIIEENNCGYFAQGDYGKLKIYLKKMLTDENDRREKGCGIDIYVRNNHNIKENIKKLKKLIHETCQN